MAEDGLQVPPAPEDLGPRRLRRYREQYLDRLRGNAPDPETQGVPVVPVMEPDDRLLEFQRRFQAISEQGEFVRLSADEEFAAIVGDRTATTYRDRALLEDVQRQILGAGPGTVSGGIVSVNPAHLSGLGNTDFAGTVYDERLLGPQTMGIPVITGSTPRVQGSHAGAGAPASADADDAVAAPEPQTDPSEPVGLNPEEAGAPEEISPGETSPAEAAQDETAEGAAQPEDARPVRAVDAHGLDLSGLDAKAPGGTGRAWLITLILLVLVAAVVLGVIFLIP
ncbi:hypothetical protein [Rothia kristinae]|uniref:hypothetical protein n=1 Tax=Rothia kristinae TaxID=37923 RepID=UPI0007361785|nr:hypothetical protein [Rothia kristinae]KTR39098.1 hypothetical protein RSA5_03230 [Rothia kristinae]KTR58271.1 hypothetical protein SA11R_05715 [Rothia kristinae]KTR73305.1 hypothetical protein SA12R_00305 [Rothia kristinae]KTR73559.1 hypothetical protein SA15R_04295 [Rothia kristinae]KTR76148.1 hypothetical protein SA14R_07630 [Rothia kristinae]